MLLRPPAKATVLAWKPGQPVPREADVVLLRNSKTTYTARVDIAAKRVVEFGELKGGQSAFLASEMFGADAYIKKDARMIEALRKRGITDLRTVSCSALPVAYRAVPEQATRAGGLWLVLPHARHVSQLGPIDRRADVPGRCHGEEGHVDFGHRDGAGAHERAELRGDPRSSAPEHDADLDVSALGQGFRIERGDISWQNWRFRMRIDPRVGVVLNLVRSWMKGAPVRCSTKPA